MGQREKSETDIPPRPPTYACIRGGEGCLHSLGERYSETIVLYLVLFIAASLAVPSPVQQKSTVAAPAYNLAIGRYWSLLVDTYHSAEACRPKEPARSTRRGGT